MNLHINLNNDIADFDFIDKYEVLKDPNNTYNISINVDDGETFDSIINYDKIRECFYKYYNNFSKYDESSNILKEYIGKEDYFYKDLLDNVRFIYLNGTIKDISNYLEKNDFLRSKSVVLGGFYNYSQDISELEHFKYLNNIYLETEGNSIPISFEEYINTRKILDDIVINIKKFNFSPLEEIMYVYDIVREREYLKEDSSESYSVSRDLSKVLSGNKIVCLGYANIFNVLLEKLGFKSKIYFLNRKGSNRGHARNMVYIDDPKYKVEGVYFFDTTWDSKKNNSLEYLYSYKYFAKTKNAIERYRKDEYLDVSLGAYTEDMVFKFIDIVNNNGLCSVPFDMIETINEMSKFIDNKSLIDNMLLFKSRIRENEIEIDKEEIFNTLYRYDNLFKKPIGALVLIKVLFNVRKLEYYSDNTKYPFDLNGFYNVVINSNWIVNDNEARLLRAIFGDSVDKILKCATRDNVLKYFDEDKTEVKIEQIKLSKTLRKVLDKNKDNK